MQNPPEHKSKNLSIYLCLLTSHFCQCGNMAREGLRTLVVAKKSLSEEQYQDFEVWMNTAVCTVYAVLCFTQ